MRSRTDAAGAAGRHAGRDEGGGDAGSDPRRVRDQARATTEVAEAIAAELREAGAEVDVRPARAVTAVAPYDAVVLGAPLYMGRWHRDARSFLRRLRRPLAQRPLAVFALGPVAEDGSDVEAAQHQFDRALSGMPVAPAEVVLFGGAIDPAGLRFPLNRMPESDARDWIRIRAWARGLPPALEGVATLSADVASVT